MQYSLHYNASVARTLRVASVREARIASHIRMPEEVDSLVGASARLWPTFKVALAAHEWVIYLFFLLLVLIFFLLLPRACRCP